MLVISSNACGKNKGERIFLKLREASMWPLCIPNVSQGIFIMEGSDLTATTSLPELQMHARYNSSLTKIFSDTYSQRFLSRGITILFTRLI